MKKDGNHFGNGRGSDNSFFDSILHRRTLVNTTEYDYFRHNLGEDYVGNCNIS